VYEPPAPARRVGPLLIVVLLVLAGVGGTMGYLVARQVLANQAAVTPPTGTQTPGRGSTTTPGKTATASPTISPDPKDEGTFCPPVTRKALTDAGLNSDLTLLLYIEVTVPRAKARAWICRNAEGTLYYQSHEKTGPFTAATSQNTILLGTGIKGDVSVLGEGYKAVNPKTNGTDTVYTITKTMFTIEPGATRAIPSRSIPA
jgi:hypothetical protein